MERYHVDRKYGSWIWRLGEHGFFWKKIICLIYDQIVHTPFFIWNPAIGCAGERRSQLCQTIDIAPTILDYFGIAPTPDMKGKVTFPRFKDEKSIHDYILFGYFGKHVNITDGRYVYMRAGRQRE